MSDEPRVSHVTVLQVARLVGVSRQAVWRRIREGKVETVEYAGLPMVAMRDVRAWQAERRRRAQALMASGL